LQNKDNQEKQSRGQPPAGVALSPKPDVQYSHRTKKSCCGDAAVLPVALARRPRLPAATRQSSVILHQSAVVVFRGGCCAQWLAFAQGQWFPGRPPFLRSGGWGVALWRAAAVSLPSRVGFPPQLVVGFTRSLSLSPRPALAGSLPPGFRRSAFHSFIMPRLHGYVNILPRKHGI